MDLKYDIVADADGKIELTSELTDINPENIEDDYYEYRIDANGKKIWLWNENSWLPPTETYINVRGSTSQNANTTFSWNRGDWVMASPDNVNDKTRVWVTDEDEDGNPVEVYKPSNNLGAGVSYDNATMTYNPHYLAGNYYQYNTATAGGRWARNHAISSICPKGWTLPRTPDSGGMFDVARKLYSSGEVKSMFTWPLYMGRNGYHLNGSVDLGGSHYWESWASSTTNVYGLTYDNVWPTDSSRYGQYWGLTVRCQVRDAGPNWGSE